VNVNEMMAALAELASDGASDAAASTALLGDIEVRLAAHLIDRGSLDAAESLLRSATDRGPRVDRQRQISEQLIRLARALRTRGSADRADDALSLAAQQGSPAAFAAQAQTHQRERRTEPAIGAWREAIKRAPGEAPHYLQLAALQEQAGDAPAALSTYVDLVEAAPTMANVLMVGERLDALEPRLPEAAAGMRVRIAMLGNATLDHLRSYLKVACYQAGLRPVIYQAGFDQYNQEILDPASRLYEFNPDVVICAIHPSRLFPTLHAYPFDLTVEQRRAEQTAGLNTLQSLLDVLTERTSAMVLVHNMVVPQHLALGVLDARDELGQTVLFTEINTRLAELARARYRNVFIVDEERVQARAGKSGATDARLWLSARMPWSEAVLHNLSREYLRYVKAARGLSRKCVVVDLDNTLWGGVIGEDGLAGIKLGSDAPGSAFVALQRQLLNLWRRGILLAVCSKNNPEDALPVFEQHPEMVLKQEHFAAMRINWQPKAENIREIAKELNIGIDSLVFLDDNPVERAAVRAALPQVLTPELPTDPSQYRRALVEIWDAFDALAMTDEDRNRNKLYQEQRARAEAQSQLEQASGSLDEYLAGLELAVEIEPCNDFSLPRISQLTGKTNQFNVTTRRYTEAEIVGMQALGWRVYSARVRDRFGDNGLTAVAIAGPAHADTWSIDTFLMSCRVMGRGVETAMFAWIADEARRAGARSLRGRYLPTAKNSMVRDLYRQHGFTLVEGDGRKGPTTWELDLADARIDVPGWLAVRTPQLV
jgi:FkbH-like protein